MSAFHTKTIAGVLEPVAQQVSHLVVLYEAGQQGQAMPDLSASIQVRTGLFVSLIRIYLMDLIVSLARLE